MDLSKVLFYRNRGGRGLSLRAFGPQNKLRGYNFETGEFIPSIPFKACDQIGGYNVFRSLYNEEIDGLNPWYAFFEDEEEQITSILTQMFEIKDQIVIKQEEIDPEEMEI